MRTSQHRLSGNPEDSDEALVRGFLESGSHPDFERIVSRYQDRVFRLVLSVLGPHLAAEAEDVTQDVFVHLYRRVHTFRSESRFGTWLFRVAYNVAAEYRRKARRWVPHVGQEPLSSLPLVGEHANPATALEAGQRRRTVRRCVEDLDEPCRTVVHLHYWMRYSVSEIASRLGMPPGTVKSHLHRARARLARHLASEERHE